MRFAENSKELFKSTDIQDALDEVNILLFELKKIQPTLKNIVLRKQNKDLIVVISEFKQKLKSTEYIIYGFKNVIQKTQKVADKYY